MEGTPQLAAYLRAHQHQAEYVPPNWINDVKGHNCSFSPRQILCLLNAVCSKTGPLSCGPLTAIISDYQMTPYEDARSKSKRIPSAKSSEKNLYEIVPAVRPKRNAQNHIMLMVPVRLITPGSEWENSIYEVRLEKLAADGHFPRLTGRHLGKQRYLELLKRLNITPMPYALPRSVYFAQQIRKLAVPGDKVILVDGPKEQNIEELEKAVAEADTPLHERDIYVVDCKASAALFHSLLAYARGSQIKVVHTPNGLEKYDWQGTQFTFAYLDFCGDQIQSPRMLSFVKKMAENLKVSQP